MQADAAALPLPPSYAEGGMSVLACLPTGGLASHALGPSFAFAAHRPNPAD